MRILERFFQLGELYTKMRWLIVLCRMQRVLQFGNFMQLQTELGFRILGNPFSLLCGPQGVCQTLPQQLAFGFPLPACAQCGETTANSFDRLRCRFGQQTEDRCWDIAPDPENTEAAGV